MGVIFGSLLFAEGGSRVSPRRARYFSLLRQRNVPKRKATPRLRPQRAALGHTCAGALAGCAVELTARLRRCVQTTTASQSTLRVCPAAHPPPRKHPGAGAATGGGGSPHGPSLRLARHARHVAPAPPGAERSDGPWGFWVPTPSVCTCGAQGMADQGSRLFERRRREFERDPASTKHRRLPAAKRRDADSRVAFLLGTFLWRSKEQVPRPPGRVPAPARNTGMQ